MLNIDGADGENRTPNSRFKRPLRYLVASRLRCQVALGWIALVRLVTPVYHTQGDMVREAGVEPAKSLASKASAFAI